jgi:hypothetical protein
MAPQDSEFLGAFDWAVIRLATYFPSSASSARLVFGTVSLITRDRPRPASAKGAERNRIGKGTLGNVFFRRTVLSARDAVAWYRNASENISTPIPTILSEVDERIDGQSLSPSSFEDDPEWPSLALPLGSDLFTSAGGPGDPAPFLGSGSPRIHRRFGDGAGFEAVTSDQSAIRFLRRRLHIDLSDYTEYLGGLALVVPDPILRRIQHILVPAEGEQKVERLVYRLVAP